MLRQRKRPLSKGENTRMIEARKDQIMKKVEELQNLTELGVCLIIPMPDGNFETWPRDCDKLRQVFSLYEENMKAQKENGNQPKRCCSVTDRLSTESFIGPSCHESVAGLEEGLEKENWFLTTDFGDHEWVANEEFSRKEFLPLEENWCGMNSMSYPSTEAAGNWLDELYDNSMVNTNITTSDNSTMFQPLQFCYPEANFDFGSVYDIPQPLQICYPATVAGFGLLFYDSNEFLYRNRQFQHSIQEQGEILEEALRSTTHEDVNTSAVGPWGTMPQVFTQSNADHMGGWVHNRKRGYYM